MPDEAYAASSWEHDVDLNGASSSGSNPFSPNISYTPPTTDLTSPTNPLPSPPRSSSESVGRTLSLKWRDSLGHSTLERRDTITTIITNPDTSNVVEPSFDENVLRMLCDLDVSGLLCGRASVRNLRPPLDQCSIPLLLDRIKQSTVSCKVSRLAAARSFRMPTVFAGGVGFLQEEGHPGGRIRPKLAETRPLDI